MITLKTFQFLPKVSLIFFVLLFSVCSNSFDQTVTTFLPQKIDIDLYNPIGISKGSYHFSAKQGYPFSGNALTYFSVPLSGGEVILTEDSDLIWEGEEGELLDFFISDDVIFEVYIVSKAKSVNGEQTIALLKRDPQNHQVIGAPIFVIDFISVDVMNGPDVSLFPSKEGFFLQTADYANKKYVLHRYSFELEKLWENDISFLFPNDESAILEVECDTDQDDLLYASNAIPKDLPGMFERTKAVSAAVLALVHFNEVGEMNAVIPEFGNDLIFAESEFVFNHEKNSVNAILKTHEKGKNEYVVPVKTGYAFYEWDMTTGSILVKKTKYFTFGDILVGQASDFLTTQKSGLAIDRSAFFPRINIQEMSVKELQGGDFIVVFNRLWTDSTDPHYINSINSNLVASAFVLRLSGTTGEILWSNFLGRNVGNYIWKKPFVIDDKLILMHNDHVKNYSSGSYEFSKDEIPPSPALQVGSCSIFDLTKGDFIGRTLVTSGKETGLIFKPLLAELDEEGRIVFVSGYGKKTSFGIWILN